MRFVIQSKDRLGITQEILTALSQKGWDLVSMEMFLHHTYLRLKESSEISVESLCHTLSHVPDITEIHEVSLMPGERRSQHLDAVLSGLPDPILDIDNQGQILLANKAACLLARQEAEVIKGQLISEFTEIAIEKLLPDTQISVDLEFCNQLFIADITPVFSEDGPHKRQSGAVIMLQSIQRIGQKINVIKESENRSSDAIIGQSQATQSLLNQVSRFAQLDMPILIQGETGTGKELLARRLHSQSQRSDLPFMAINCAAMPENLLESELFGYAPGAFSGARRNGKPGLMEVAEGGTVFLDEIGEMSPYLQAKLLRFLQEYSFRRIGGDKEITVNVRIISATHRNLLDMAESHDFREDLYYRLNVLNLKVPSLRERKADIPELAQYFIQLAAEQTERPAPELGECAMRLLMRHSWPGNIRQLQNTLFRAVAMSDDQKLTSQHLSKDESCAEAIPETPEPEAFQKDWQTSIEEFERSLLKSLFPAYPSSRKLAKRLGVSHNTIAMKLKKYQISS